MLQHLLHHRLFHSNLFVFLYWYIIDYKSIIKTNKPHKKNSEILLQNDSFNGGKQIIHIYFVKNISTDLVHIH